MPDTDAGTVKDAPGAATPPEPATDSTTNDLVDFDKAVFGWSPQEAEGSGQPAEAKAVEASEKETAPEAVADKPKGDEKPPEDPAKPADKPDSSQAVNFDGLSDPAKQTLEKLLRAGQVTPQDVEEIRKGYLRHDNYSRKTGSLAREREAFEKEKAGWKEDYEVLQKIRGSDELHRRWLEAKTWKESESTDSDPERLATIKDIDERNEAREREKAQKAQSDEVAYETRAVALSEALSDWMREHPVERKVAEQFFAAEEARWHAKAPKGVDPARWLVMNVAPDELTDRLTLRYEAAAAKAEAEAAKKQVSETTAKRERTSKQSLAPAPRVADRGPKSPAQFLEEQLGIDPDWSNVQGFGFRTNDR